MASWTLPIKTVSEANMGGEHWSKKHKRHKTQKTIIRLWGSANKIVATTIPATIRLTRLAPRKLDYDNLVSSFKPIRDYVADIIFPGLAAGRADSDERLTWEYDQEKSPIYAIRIEISSLQLWMIYYFEPR